VRPIFERIVSGTSTAPPGVSQAGRSAKFSATRNELPRHYPISHRAPEDSISRHEHGRSFASCVRPYGMASKTADPDTTLNQFVRLVEGYGLRSLFFELLVANPRLLELVVKTFDASHLASELLIRRPQLLEDITRDPTFGEPRSVAEN